MSSSSPAPGTLFRAFNAEKTAHATAVLLKNGSILQVKNGEGARAVYPSLEGWLAAIHADPANVITDAAAAQGVVIGGDTHGFNYVCAERAYQVPDKNRWTNWCYERMAEMTPQFLARDDIRAAFNALVAECNALPEREVHFSYLYDSKPKKYSPDNFRWMDSAEAGGVPIAYSYHYKSTPSKQKYNEAAARVKAVYKTFYDLVGEELRRKLNIYHDLTTAEKQMKYYAQRARCIQKKMEALVAVAAETTKKLEVHKKKMEDLRAGL